MTIEWHRVASALLHFDVISANAHFGALVCATERAEYHEGRSTDSTLCCIIVMQIQEMTLLVSLMR